MHRCQTRSNREGATMHTLTVVLRASHPRLRGEQRHRTQEGATSHRGRTSRPMVPPCPSDVPAFYPERPAPCTVIPMSLHHGLVKGHTHLSRPKFDTGTARRPTCVWIAYVWRRHAQCQSASGTAATDINERRLYEATHVKYTQFGGPVAPPISARYVGS